VFEGMRVSPPRKAQRSASSLIAYLKQVPTGFWIAL
jgi:hypothetical protein